MQTYFFTKIDWLPIIIFWAAYIAAAISYFTGFKAKFFNFKLLIIFVIVCRFIYAALLSVLQYYVWSASEITRILLNSPISQDVPLSNFLRNNFNFIFESKLGYFLFYSWGHFWVNVLLAVGLAFAFYAFLKALKRYNGRFFVEGETELGLLLALIVGWPNFVLFVPIAMISVVVVSLLRLIFLKEQLTTLGQPMLLAALVVMIFGSSLIEIFNLVVLRI